VGLGGAVQATVRSNHETGAQSLRDLSAVRSFLVGPAIPPPLDASWSPIFLASLFIVHPVLGLVGLSGALLLLGLALLNELATRSILQRAAVAGAHAQYRTEASLRK